MRTLNLTVWALVWATASQLALAQSGPKIKAPSFPLEPNRKAPRKIDPKSYVSARDEPPPSIAEALIPEVQRTESQWWRKLDLGWFFANRNAKHLVNSETIRGTGASALSLSARYDARMPWLPVSLVGQMAGSFGSGEVNADNTNILPVHFSLQDVRGAAGLRLHAFPRRWRMNLALGADVGFVNSSYETLSRGSSGTNLADIDSRILFLLTPRAEIRYAPSPNWAVELGAGYSKLLRSSGTGDVAGLAYHRTEGDVNAIRYVSTGNAIGVGGIYSEEIMQWTQTIPVALIDDSNSKDIRLNLFWRHDL